MTRLCSFASLPWGYPVPLSCAGQPWFCLPNIQSIFSFSLCTARITHVCMLPFAALCCAALAEPVRHCVLSAHHAVLCLLFGHQPYQVVFHSVFQSLCHSVYCRAARVSAQRHRCPNKPFIHSWLAPALNSPASSLGSTLQQVLP